MALDFPPPGRLIDIGGHRLHLHVTGAGSPAVVFESGGASWSLDWTLVQAGVSRFTRACAYDRAGFGWSDPGPRPRTSARIAAELHTLLAAAGIEPPYVLVGASFGGHIVRLFASAYPDEVAGIILLDARHEALDARMPPAWKKLQQNGRGMYQVLLLASRLGLLKLLGKGMGEKAAPPILAKLPPELRPVYLEMGFHSNFLRSNLDELAAVAESDRQAADSVLPAALPLTVIRHGLPDLFAAMPAGEAQQAEAVWQELQAGLARLSSRGRLLVAEGSGHAIQVDAPDLVVGTVRQMVTDQKRTDGGQQLT
jgi:pimeloyl-ACP methyl ester carboxylesterase